MRKLRRLIADQLGVPNFKASNGWFNRWKKHYDIHEMKINGESGDVAEEIVALWRERIPELLAGYSAENVWNLDEIGCFWRALPGYGFGKKGLCARLGRRLNKGLRLL